TFFEGYALGTEDGGVRVVSTPRDGDWTAAADLPTFRQYKAATDQSAVPLPPVTSFPLDGIGTGVPFVESATDFHWQDDLGRQHRSDLAFLSTPDGTLRVLVTADAVDGITVRHPLGEGDVDTTPLVAAVRTDSTGFRGTMAFDAGLGVLFV